MYDDLYEVVSAHVFRRDADAGRGLSMKQVSTLSMVSPIEVALVQSIIPADPSGSQILVTI